MIDPWSSAIVNYEKLIEEFGIKPFHDLLGDIENPHILMRRGIVFGHRDFGRIIKAIREKSEFAVVTGMMPSGKMHIGHKMIVDQLTWYQEKGAEIHIPIADMESYSARGIDFNEAKRIAIEEYITNYIALGLDPDNEKLHIYLQSENKIVGDLAYKLAKRVNMNEMKAIYGFSGSTNIAHIYAPLIQVADILHPQIKECGGPKPTVVPVGPDQDPHIRLTRDIAERFQSQFEFITPSSTYHRFITGLTGGKMSSSKPKTAIFLSDTPEVAEKKLKSAKTGGRESLEEQKKMGGVPEDCVVYEMLLYHLIQSDDELKEIYHQCQEGSIMCGECKARSAEMMKNFFKNFHKKREKAKDKAESILDL
ncbi:MULTISPECIES: tryptophan--tRNA ligase [Methanobacterium]|uniref:Tryptophan--tRNA ligase n=1 Tax=Methanobacterium subterraneum TaxID=59277 RepID=A0A2H4VCR0_9EURY|nr:MULTISPECIES: tryptophan--tRNA ligase [Methanobacterium]MBW4257985.1 tryptophan--tRNA ligase [Methanobacterium sp. YSL]PKL73186.1 MAG: tryptophan--tRNA ligase [Methanobacteriales archaeon HGW-Methanobacteriales-2]AUB55884.1 tryptophan--tRNA ligase [Methanobacterium subterraneum]AUB57105.1 tryptophan--tRNA ligase [Methanobacterium sp. MZ-A1]AUB60247.1 tryptophan--tRNA ligase [Methanobacterium subterraneum]